MPASMVILLVAGKGFTARSSRSSSISSIICLVRGQLGVGRWMSSPCAAQFFFQFINFTFAFLYHSLHGKHDFSLKTGFYWYSCVHTSFMISLMLKVYKRIAMLRPFWILLGVNLHPLGVVTLFFGVGLILPSLTLHWSLLQNRSSSSHRRRQL